MEKYTMFMDQKNHIVKMSILPKAIYRFNASLIKLPTAFFTELEQKLYSLCRNTKDPEQTKNSWERMELEESIFLTSDYTAKLQSQNSMVLAQNLKYRPMEQDRNPRNKPLHLWVPNFWQWGKDSLFNKWCWESWIATCKRMKLEHFLTPYTI